MGKLHHVPFFFYEPAGVSRLAVDETSQKLAVARITDHESLIEIWDMVHWFHEQTLLPVKSVEALVWYDGRLFSGGLHASLVEHDLHSGGIKSSDSAMSAGAIWCMALNKEQKMIAAGTEASSVLLFDISDGVHFHKSLSRLEGRITSIAWYEPLNVIVTGGMDLVRVWNVNSGNMIQKIMIPRENRNKETIIWGISAFGNGDEMMIVSGDSTGKVHFWSGPPDQFTRSKCIQSHRSDIRTISVAANGQTIFASGVDPLIQSFKLNSSDHKEWIISQKYTHHQNDVNALVCINDSVISAGLDSKIVITSFAEEKKATTLPGIPQKSLVCMARQVSCLLIQYPTRLEMWKLGDAIDTHEGHGAVLQLASCQKLLLNFNMKNKLIICSSMSQCGKWLACGDKHSVRLYKFAMEEVDSDNCTQPITPIEMVDYPKVSAHCVAFSPNSKFFVSASRDGVIRLVKLDETGEVAFVKSRKLPKEDYGPVTLLTISPCSKYIAVSELRHGVHVFRLKKLKLVCTLPKCSSQPTAFAFHPNSEQLLVSYSDRKVVEYDFLNEKFSSWSDALNESLYFTDWNRRVNQIRQIFYFPCQPEIVVLQDDECFVMIDKRERLPSQQVNIFNRNTSSNESNKDHRRSTDPCAFHCTESKYLLHLDFLKDDVLIAVERSPNDLLEALPPPFKKHKFGV